MTMLAEPAETVSVSRDRATLRLVSHTNGTVALPSPALRAACRCAQCTRDRIDGVRPDNFDGITIATVAPIGRYGLNIAFSDGHARGIFPWHYLAQLASRSAKFPDRSTA